MNLEFEILFFAIFCFKESDLIIDNCSAAELQQVYAFKVNFSSSSQCEFMYGFKSLAYVKDRLYSLLIKCGKRAPQKMSVPKDAQLKLKKRKDLLNAFLLKYGITL